LKANKCDIDYVCYTLGDVNPKNSSQNCDPSKSLFTWSSKTITVSKASSMSCITSISILFLILSKLFTF
jgi:hypothetical protein